MTAQDAHCAGRVIRVGDAIASLDEVAPQKFTELFTHGSLSVEIYRPGDVDDQTPHERDELYVVISGTGEFIYDSTRSAVGPGDCLFVAAGVEHRFENFEPGLTVWVFFYGPVGGESPAPL